MRMCMLTYNIEIWDRELRARLCVFVLLRRCVVRPPICSVFCVLDLSLTFCCPVGWFRFSLMPLTKRCSPCGSHVLPMRYFLMVHTNKSTNYAHLVSLISKGHSFCVIKMLLSFFRVCARFSFKLVLFLHSFHFISIVLLAGKHELMHIHIYTITLVFFAVVTDFLALSLSLTHGCCNVCNVFVRCFFPLTFTFDVRHTHNAFMAILIFLFLFSLRFEVIKSHYWFDT